MMDRVRAFFQGKRLSAAERAVLQRTCATMGCKDNAATIEQLSVRETFIPGQVIVERGAPSQDMFFILDGTCKVMQNEEPPYHVHDGAFFGELGMLTGAPRFATVIANRTTVVLRIPSDAIGHDLRERLWAYAAEQSFLSLDELPVNLSTREREIWFSEARHATLREGNFDICASWIFLYEGEVELNGERVSAPALFPNGVIHTQGSVRIALLGEP